MSTAANKAEYHELSLPIKKSVDAVKKKIDDLKKKRAGLDLSNTPDVIKCDLSLAHLILEEIGAFIMISKLSLKKLDIKNEATLNQARKNLYLVIQIFEEMLGREIDAPLTHNEKLLEKFSELHSNLERFELIKKIAVYLQTIKYLYGDNSKWKWSFVELEGRLVAVFKNIISFTQLFKNLDPSIEGYHERMDLLRVLNEQIDYVSERYRSKYELTGKGIDDMKSALGFLSFKKRIAVLMGDNEMVSNCKKKIETWKKKLNDDIAASEKPEPPSSA